ncbi:MAG TPA: AraC family transcriptional regulator ligand-binding domain-containing protein [Aquabacterium sp.]|nr:AraC family transcriptional regulator ligand-binding domain-containing protein [Aquabacterium sp.]
MKSFTLSKVPGFLTVRALLAQRGVDVDDLLHRAGVDLSSVRHHDLAYVCDLFSRIWSLAVRETGDTSIGLTKPLHPFHSFGLVAHLLISAPDLMTALSSLARVSGMLSPSFSMGVSREGGLCTITVTALAGKLPVPMQRYDSVATVVLEGARWLTGRQLTPKTLFHPAPMPDSPQRWEQAFGCRVAFGASSFRAVFDEKDLLIPIPTADPTMAALCERMSNQSAQEQTGHFTAKVRQVLSKNLAKGDPRREHVAEVLCLSERTLQRRLSEEGTNFAELVDKLRQEMAERLLAQGHLSTTEIAFELGFSDPSNFYRACKRWFGHSPSGMRPQH